MRHGEAWDWTDLPKDGSFNKLHVDNDIDFAYFNDTTRNGIKGEDDGLGAITGGLLGAIIGCGEGIFDDECRDTVAVVGAIGGAILGNAVASRLGDHDGFQYVVDIDNSDEDISIIQSGEEQIPIGSKVTVSIGSNTRIIISE